MKRAIFLISHSVSSELCVFLWKKSETSAVPVVKLDTMVQARVDLKNKSTRPQKAATSIPHNRQASKRQTELPYTTIE